MRNTIVSMGMAILGIAALCASALAQATRPATTSTAALPAAVVRVEGHVDDYTRDNLIRQINEARGRGATTIIIELNTYGGLSTAGLDISRFLKGLSDVRTVAYVNDKAISAGTMIALACNQIVMAPSAVIGDCAPIAVSQTGSLQPLPPTERGKIESPIAADFYDSAIRRGYDPLLVDSMITVGHTIYWMENDQGQRRFVNEQQYERMQSSGQWRLVELPGVPNPVLYNNRLLTVHTQQAIQLGLAAGSAASLNDLASQQNLSIIAQFEPTLGEALIQFLISGWARGLLLSVFLMALYAALHAPGHGGAEAVAVVALALLLGVPLLAGYATWWEIAAILLGLALLALEIFVIPGFGITGIAGIVLILGGLILTFAGPEPGKGGWDIWPTLPATWAALQKGLIAVTGGLLGSLLLSLWLRRYLPKLPYFNRLILTTSVGGSATAGAAGGTSSTKAWPPVGTVGRAVTDLRPGGSAEFEDLTGDRRIMAVVSDSGYVQRGTPVVVREAAGWGDVVVRPMPTKETAA